jgi:HD-GYP domain-containing protein (c-di-GMP phosphodiesterase class II)
MKNRDDHFLEKVLRHGSAVVTNLAILIRLIAIYDGENEAVTSAVNRLLAEVSAFAGEDGEVTLTMAEHSFFIDDFRVRATVTNLETFDSLARELAEKGVGAITFRSPVEARDVVRFAVALRRGEQAERIQAELEAELIRSVSVGGPVSAKKEDADEARDARLTARRAYLRALASFAEMCNSFEQHRTPGMKKAKRAIQSLVDSIAADEQFVLGFTALESAGEYGPLHSHSINVAILSIVTGKRAGFPRTTLGLLGIAALLHDIGKIELPPALRVKSPEQSGKEAELMDLHSEEGARILLRYKGLTETTILSMLAAYEHHMAGERAGREINVVSQIIGVADAFDTIVHARVFGERMFSPHEAPKEALRILYAKGARTFKPALVKALASAFV